ncbi:MAG: creatininase family protein [Anaerolineae bacterium]|nr:creatininase family protein [Anaerolineae bacterium]
MKIADMNWMQVEAYLQTDDRCILPLGSTEQHAYLSLCVDIRLPEKLALDVAEPLGVPVFPTLAYGLTPYFRAFPGSVTLRHDTYLRIIRDVLDSLAESGFRRILIINGHGGNSPAAGLVKEWMADHPGFRVKWHNWWNAPKTWAKVQAIDPDGSHASWMENFPWTRLPDIELPTSKKSMADHNLLNVLSPKEVRAYLGDGNFGGVYQRSDEDMLALWAVALEETRDLLMENWG